MGLLSDSFVISHLLGIQTVFNQGMFLCVDRDIASKWIFKLLLVFLYYLNNKVSYLVNNINNNFIMKNIIVKGVLLGYIISLLCACNAQKEEPQSVVIDKEQIKKEIQAKEDSFAALYNIGEVRSIGYYADDATSFYQNRPPIVGKDSIISFLKNDVVSNTDKITFKTKEVFVSNDGNQVVEIGSFTVVDSTNTPFNTGNYMSLFEKRNGKYVAVRDMSASDMPIR